MDEETSLKLHKTTEDAVNTYNDYKGRKIILTENEILSDYNYKTATVERNVEPIVYGFTDRYFGGNIFKCAIVKNSPFVILIDQYMNTLGVHIPNENLEKCTVDFIKDLCAKFSVDYLKTDTKKILISKLTDIA